MNRPNRNNNGNNRDEEDNWGAAVAGAAAVAGGLYYLTRSSDNAETSTRKMERRNAEQTTRNTGCSSNTSSGFSTSAISALTGKLEGLFYTPESAVNIPKSSVPLHPKLNGSLNALLEDIYVRFVALKTEEFTEHYNVFQAIVKELQDKMKEVDRYYAKYSSRIKKLRDAQGMKEIASYFIKTLFFYEILERKDDPLFWNNNPATLFKIMLQKLYVAIASRSIPYFWHKDNNLIGHVSSNVLDGYRQKLAELLSVLEGPDNCKMVAKFLLTAEEFQFYRPYF